MQQHADFRWAVIGPGGIAHRFAEAVQALPGSRIAAVWGRNREQCRHAVAHWTRADRPPPTCCDDVGSLLADPTIDAVYIATPHSAHAEFALRALDAGKPVLCEKPMAPTHALTRTLVAHAAARRVFLMEALWTRCLPVYAQVGAWLRGGAIGQVRSIESSFCLDQPYDPASRLFNPALGGGALLDVGIYCLAMSRWALQALGNKTVAARDIEVTGTLAPSGVDRRASVRLRLIGGDDVDDPGADARDSSGTDVGDKTGGLADGVSVQFVCGFDTVAENALHIVGRHGAVSVPEMFWEGRRALLSRPGQTTQLAEAPLRINGFEEEIEETQRCVRAGLLQSPLMPHAESLALARDLESMRRQLGVHYPFD